MVVLSMEKLRPKLDLENKYVEFNLLRSAITVLSVVEKLEAKLTEPDNDGECRSNCPKCQQKRAFALNINTNRFNCFNKGCSLKGSGVIDFAQTFFDINSKEAAHLLACAYAIPPYSSGNAGESPANSAEHTESREVVNFPIVEKNNSTEYVTKAEFDELKIRFERLHQIVFDYVFQYDEEEINNYENGYYDHTVTH